MLNLYKIYIPGKGAVSLPLMVIPLLLSLVLTFISMKLARHFNIMAIPDERSSHVHPTPRIGGIGFAVPFLGFLIIATFFTDKYAHIKPFITALLLGGSLAFLLGLADDIRTLQANVKLGGQVIICFIPLLHGIHIEQLYIPFMGKVAIGSYGIILTFIWLLFFINAFNFMDGMDGKAASFTLTVFIFLMIYYLLIVRVNGKSPEDEFMFTNYMNITTILLMIIPGFLVFNLPPARTFMGDCGSQFLGYVIGIAAVAALDNFIGFFILLLPFSYDVIFTLVKRAKEGKNLLKAHRSHLYQRLMIAGFSHTQTLLICVLTYIGCGICFLVFSLATSHLLKTISMVSSVLIMVIYTLFVWHREKKAGKRIS